MPERWWSRWRSHDLLLLHARGLWDGARSWPDLAAWCAEHRGRGCRLWLSSALLHELVCDPALPLADDAAVLAWARPLLQHYHGDAALAWPLAAWQQGKSRGVSALHGVSLDALRQTARDAGVRLHSVMPWWSLLLRQALRRHRALRGTQAQLLVLEGDRVAVLGLARGRLVRLQLRRLELPPLHDAAADMLAPWCADAAATPTLALGYGTRLGRQTPGALAQPAAAEWLAGARA